MFLMLVENMSDAATLLDDLKNYELSEDTFCLLFYKSWIKAKEDGERAIVCR